MDISFREKGIAAQLLTLLTLLSKTKFCQNRRTIAIALPSAYFICLLNSFLNKMQTNLFFFYY